jgi:uncharacterized protein
MNPVRWLLFLATFALTSAEEHPIELHTANGTLHGSLLLPEEGVPVPVVLFVAGSGPTDRNGNGLGGLHTDCYRQLAAELAATGIASVRYDKRGVAASRAAASRESDLRFEHYADDAASWSELLKADARFSSVFILGHSEGAHLGILAAQRSRIAGFISVAGAGEPAADVLRQQLRPQLPPDLWASAEKILASLTTGELPEDPVPPELAALFRPSVQPYLISWFRHDPAAGLAKLAAPVLIVQGTTDLQVGLPNAHRLHAARPEVRLVVIEGMNHVLKTDHGDLSVQWLRSYTNPAIALAPELAPAVAECVKTHSLQ